VPLEKPTGVDPRGGESCECWGCECRRGRKRTGEGPFSPLTPRQKARRALKARLRELLRRGGAPPLEELRAPLHAVRTGGGAVLARGERESRG